MKRQIKVKALLVTIGISISELSRLMTADKEGYIPKDSLNILEIDVAALDEEMARTEQEA